MFQYRNGRNPGLFRRFAKADVFAVGNLPYLCLPNACVKMNFAAIEPIVGMRSGDKMFRIAAFPVVAFVANDSARHRTVFQEIRKPVRQPILFIDRSLSITGAVRGFLPFPAAGFGDVALCFQFFEIHPYIVSQIRS